MVIVVQPFPKKKNYRMSGLWCGVSMSIEMTLFSLKGTSINVENGLRYKVDEVDRITNL